MKYKTLMLCTSLLSINTLGLSLAEAGNFTEEQRVEFCSTQHNGNNHHVIHEPEEMDQEPQVQQTPRRALRGLIRTYLLPLYEQNEQEEMLGEEEIHPNIVQFLREARELFPLLPEDTSLEQAQVEVAQQWKYADFSDQALEYFLTLHKKKKGTRSHSQALVLLAGSYLGADCLPPHYERAFRLFLNIGRLEERQFLTATLDGLSLLLGNHGEAAVGDTERKKDLARKAATVLRKAYEQLLGYPKDDCYY